MTRSLELYKKPNPRKSKADQTACPLVGSGILNPWIILKNPFFVPNTIQTFAQMKLEILEFTENGGKKNNENVEVGLNT